MSESPRDEAGAAAEAVAEAVADTVTEAVADTSRKARGVVITHGTLGQGLIDAVARIAGADTDALVAVSNADCSPDDLQHRIGEAMGEHAGPLVLFTDLGAGSCTLAARLTCRERGAVPVVTGVNLPMLLDFVFHRDLPVEQLAERLCDKGRDGVRVMNTA